MNIELEKLRMNFEMLCFGRCLLVGNGESIYFWRKLRHLAGNRWFRFWQNKSDEQIINTLTLKTKKSVLMCGLRWRKVRTHSMLRGIKKLNLNQL